MQTEASATRVRLQLPEWPEQFAFICISHSNASICHLRTPDPSISVLKLIRLTTSVYVNAKIGKAVTENLSIGPPSFFTTDTFVDINPFVVNLRAFDRRFISICQTQCCSDSTNSDTSGSTSKSYATSCEACVYLQRPGNTSVAHAQS